MGRFRVKPEDTHTDKVFYLWGRKEYAAYRVGDHSEDECGQVPWYFINGTWKNTVVLVEPFKMEENCE